MMKFQMSAEEFATFGKTCAAAAIASLTVEHQLKLAELNNELEDMRHERAASWDQTDSLRSDLRAAQRESENKNYEMSRLRDQVDILQARIRELESLIPNRKERGLSEMFALHASGQKIQAIKKLRELEGIGLKEAKDAVEGAFSDHKYPRLVAISQVCGAYHTSTIEHLTRLLKPTVNSDLTEGDLMLIVTGKFHQTTAVAAE